MRSFVCVIRDRAGIHARPAGIVVREAKKYQSDIRIIAGEKRSDVKNLMQLMSMGICCGDEITVEISGEDEESAAKAMLSVFEECL